MMVCSPPPARPRATHLGCRHELFSLELGSCGVRESLGIANGSAGYRIFESSRKDQHSLWASANDSVKGIVRIEVGTHGGSRAVHPLQIQHGISLVTKQEPTARTMV